MKKKENKKKGSSPAGKQGVLSVASGGTGYVAVEGIDEDVQIQPQFLQTALHGDTVKIALLPKSKQHSRLQGEVTEVVKRAREEFVGTLDTSKEKNFAFLIPDDSRIQTDIFIPNTGKKVRNNHKALVKIVDWGNEKKNPTGEIVELLGKKGDNDAEMHSILLESGYRPGFSKEIKKDAQKIQKKAANISDKERANRKDMTAVTTFSIDPEDAKDLDDALSVRTLENGMLEIGVHIADVSHYIPEDSPLDLHAREKGTSVYLVDRTIHMLPEELSADVCSLHPGTQKRAFSVLLQVDKKGEVHERWFGKTIINSDARFSYKEAQERINSGNGAHAQELRQLDKLAKQLQKKREERGALTFEKPEVQFELADDGTPVSISVKKVLPAHKMIEECMILANRAVAEFFAEKEKEGGFGIYRVHEAPQKRNVHDLMEFLNALGYDLNIPENHLTPKQLNNLFKQVEGKEEEYLVEETVMRDMEKAVYSTKNRGHFGLALNRYTHFTSPIRRYADILVHRLLHSYLTGEPFDKEHHHTYKDILTNLTPKESQAVRAERDSIKYKQVEYLLEHDADEYEGIVMSIFSWGIFVQENHSKAEGLIRTRDMQDDFYTLDEENYRLVGEKTGNEYKVGDTVKIRVTGGDVDQKQLDFTLVS